MGANRFESAERRAVARDHVGTAGRALIRLLDLLCDALDDDPDEDDETLEELIDEIHDHQAVIRAHASARTRRALDHALDVAADVLEDDADPDDVRAAADDFEVALRYEVGPRR